MWNDVRRTDLREHLLAVAESVLRERQAEGFGEIALNQREVELLNLLINRADENLRLQGVERLSAERVYGIELKFRLILLAAGTTSSPRDYRGLFPGAREPAA